MLLGTERQGTKYSLPKFWGSKLCQQSYISGEQSDGAEPVKSSISCVASRWLARTSLIKQERETPDLLQFRAACPYPNLTRRF